MTATSIGVQIITPKTATAPEQAPQQQTNARETIEATAEPKPAPPPPLGRFVDKFV
jgi:hypothetical protein